MDELVKEMNDIEADLDNHLQHVSTDDEVGKPDSNGATSPVCGEHNRNELKSPDSFRHTRKPELPAKSPTVVGWKKPVPPPRPVMSGAEDSCSSIGSDTSSIGSRSPCINSLPRRKCSGKGKVSDSVSNKQWIGKKIHRENINLSLLPYTSKVCLCFSPSSG